MNKTFLTFSLALAGFFSIITGVGIWITDKPLMSLCRRHCWINALLYGVFGEFYGKAINGSVDVGLGITLLAITLRRILKKT